MANLVYFLQRLIRYYEVVVIITVVLSWVFATGRLNRFDPRLREIMTVLDGLTQPLLRRIRPWMPKTGALDLSPLVLLLLCEFIDQVVLQNLIA